MRSTSTDGAAEAGSKTVECPAGAVGIAKVEDEMPHNVAGLPSAVMMLVGAAWCCAKKEDRLCYGRSKLPWWYWLSG